ncbi:hypothetical protein Ancab_005004 [Ancistrocladus abbreviatus]
MEWGEEETAMPIWLGASESGRQDGLMSNSGAMRLTEMTSTCGILEEENIEKAERMVTVALWCVQYLPATRPSMLSVVKMLEGGVKIDLPPNPFLHLEDNLALNSSVNNVDSDQSSTAALINSVQSCPNPNPAEKLVYAEIGVAASV